MLAEASGTRPVIEGRNDQRTPAEGGDFAVRAIANAARSAVDDAGSGLHDVIAVGLASPGPLDPRTGVVHQTQNIRGFTSFPLAEKVSVALDGIPVFVDRDTCMAAVGEAVAGAAVGVKDFVYVTVSTGLGGAIVSGGRMIRGASGTAGEIGHQPVGLDGPICGCGSIGCVESYAAGRNLAEAYGADGAHQVYTAARAGDQRAISLVKRAELALGNLAVGLVNVLNPSLIVVGGSVAEHEPGHVLEPMRDAIAKRAFKTPAAAVRVVPAALGADVGMIGAVLSARERAAGRGGWFI